MPLKNCAAPVPATELDSALNVADNPITIVTNEIHVTGSNSFPSNVNGIANMQSLNTSEKLIKGSVPRVIKCLNNVKVALRTCGFASCCFYLVEVLSTHSYISRDMINGALVQKCEKIKEHCEWHDNQVQSSHKSTFYLSKPFA